MQACLMANKIIAMQLPLGFFHLLLLKCYAKSLSHHEQVCLMSILVHGMRNFLYYEHLTEKQKYF